MELIWSREFDVDLVSVNSMYGLGRVNKATGQRAKFLTDKAKQMKKDIEMTIGFIDFGPIDYPIHIEYDLTFSDRRKRDISNYIKCFEDALVEQNVLLDDNINIIKSFTVSGKIDVELFIHRVNVRIYKL